MERSQLDELAMSYISDLVDQLIILQEKGDEVSMAIVHQEIKDLTRALDSNDASDNFFFATDYRYLA